MQKNVILLSVSFFAPFPMQRFQLHIIPFPGKEPYNIFLVLSPSNFVDKGIILDKNGETPRIYRDFDEEYRKFRQKNSLVLPRLPLF